MSRKPACLPTGTRISDLVTLGVLTITVPGELIDGVLADTGRQSRRYRQLPARLMVYLSLSRLNHWLPRGQADPKVMQGTADFHHAITNALLPQAALTTRQRLTLLLTCSIRSRREWVGSLLRQWQFRARWFLGRHEDLHLRKGEGHEAEILQQPAPGR